ncbi:phosphotransferase family protein [Rhodococcus sp. CX]|uniref:phosphotransferase family protein n=1 Tax=Rhodococcus sp. CX TaxID=2789880 RepID=UPI0018CCC22E|nr:phosphotransferase family protein [Rhodococcus sp. CX]MBH0119531.1 phosphotransferase family protein [Rhodococcus sp. CX]
MSTLRATLQGFLTERLPDHADLEVTEPLRLGGGSSQENWSFDLSWDRGGARQVTPLLLRREPASGVVDTARDAEFELLRVLGTTDVPVAKVHWIDDGAVFDRPSMIVERRSGAAHRGVLRDTDPLDLGEHARLRLAGRLAELIAQVHRVDVETLGLDRILPNPGKNPAEAELERWETELDKVELEPQPALRFVARWLRDHIPPPPERLVLVHGDFRPANVLVHEGRLETLLDWELAHLGDPVDDLGWYTCSIYSREHFLPGRWQVEDFLSCYVTAMGTGQVESGRLHFWQVMASFRLAIIALAGIRNFCLGDTDRPAAPADHVARHALADTGQVGRHRTGMEAKR